MREEDQTLRTVHRDPPWNRLPRVVERLDEERLETLRTWGAGLSANARDELRAAGKAILMLVDEIDRLEADLWNARAATKQAEGEAAAAKEAETVAAAAATVATEQAPAVPVEEPVPTATLVAAESPPPSQRAPRRSPTVEPSQVLALTLSERIARGRPPSSETA